MSKVKVYKNRNVRECEGYSHYVLNIGFKDFSIIKKALKLKLSLLEHEIRISAPDCYTDADVSLLTFLEEEKETCFNLLKEIENRGIIEL